jgi:aminopeptidase N
MVRTIIDDDKKWRQILRGLNKRFYHSTVDYSDIVNYINEQAGKDLSNVFAQYVRHPNIPTLEFYFSTDGKASCRWIADEPGFDMPVRIRTKGGQYRFIQPTRRPTPIDIPGLTRDNLEVDTFNFYIGVLVNE